MFVLLFVLLLYDVDSSTVNDEIQGPGAGVEGVTVRR